MTPTTDAATPAGPPVLVGLPVLSPSADAAIRLSDVSIRFGATTVVDSVTVSFPCGKLSAIIGPNGAGKTTLLHAILGLVPHHGKIEFCPVHAVHGDQTDRPRTGQARLAYVPQRLDFDRNLPVRVIDFLAMPIQHRPLFLGVSRRMRADALAALAGMEAEKLIDQQLGQLSGGELQRVMLAAAALRRPDVLLLDEPISGVDVLGEQLFCDLIERLRQSLGCTVLLVSHDLSVVSRHAEFVLCLNKRMVCSGHPAELLASKTLQELYGGPVRLYAHDHG